MLSKILMIPFVVLAFAFLFMAVLVDSGYAMWAVPFVVALAVIYVMSPQINWWWYQKHPPRLAEPLVKMLLARLPFFRGLPPAEKTRFCTRIALYMEANEFRPQGTEKVPEDVKAVIAASVVQLTFGMDDYLLNKFEHIIVYPHPFPSPQYERWHACENYEPDGAILFSAEQLMAGFAAPQKFFHIGLYEYAKVLQICHPDFHFPDWPADSWGKLTAVSGFSKAALEKWVGLPDLDLTAVAVAHFFVFPEKFKTVLPQEYDTLAAVLGLRP